MGSPSTLTASSTRACARASRLRVRRSAARRPRGRAHLPAADAARADVDGGGDVDDDEDGYVEYLITPPERAPAPETPAAEPEPPGEWQRLMEDRDEPDPWSRQLITEPILAVREVEPIWTAPLARHRLSDNGFEPHPPAGRHRRVEPDDAF